MLSTDRALLHIIDIQERLFTVMYNKDELMDNMVRLLKGVQILELPVIWIEQYPKGLGPTIPELASHLEFLKPIEKMSFSSCLNPDFLEELKVQGRDQIMIMGIESHVCVYQTVAGLLEKGFEVWVVADAVSSRTEKNYQIGLHAMEALGAKITSVEMALFELLQVAGTDKFRNISKIIK